MLFFDQYNKIKNLSYFLNNEISNVKLKIVNIRRKAINGNYYLEITDINDT